MSTCVTLPTTVVYYATVTAHANVAVCMEQVCDYVVSVIATTCQVFFMELVKS
jgi:hypothetical protein